MVNYTINSERMLEGSKIFLNFLISKLVELSKLYEYSPLLKENKLEFDKEYLSSDKVFPSLSHKN